MNLSTEQFLTKTELDAIAVVMDRKYASQLNHRRFEVTANQDAKGVYAKVTLKNKSGSFFYPVEGRIANIDHDMQPKEAAIYALDYIDAYFAEFFREGGEVYLPIDWSEYEYDGIPIQIKGQILNLEVEKMADELLEQAANTTLH